MIERFLVWLITRLAARRDPDRQLEDRVHKGLTWYWREMWGDGNR